MKNYSLLSRYRSQLFGLSIIGIMIFHYFENVLGYLKSGTTFEIAFCFNKFIGSIGVEIFLFLSGMGLYFSLSKNYNLKQFYKKRFVRVLVPYLLYGCIAWFVIDIILKKLSFYKYIHDLSLLSFWTNGVKTIWFIALIIPMYIAFPLVFEMVNSKKGFLKTVVVCLAIAFVCVCSNQSAPKSFGKIEIAFNRIPIFIIGTYFGKLAFEKQEIKKSHLPWLFMGIPIKLFFAFSSIFNFGSPLLLKFQSHFSRYINSYYSVGLIFLCILIFENIKIKPIDKLLCLAGSVSLELYIVHVTIRSMVILLKAPIYHLPVYLATMVVSVFIAIILHIASTKIIAIFNPPQKI